MRYAILSMIIVAGISSPALSTTSYDASLPFVSDPYLDSIIGDGIQNDNFVVTESNGVAVGIQALERYVGIVPNSNDLYYVPAGTGDFPNGTLYPGMTRWGILWAVDLGGKTLSDLEIRWTIDFDPTENNTNQPVMKFTPTASVIAASESIGWNYWTTTPESVWNSGGVTWDNFSNIADVDPNALGWYDSKIEVYDVSATPTLLASAEMTAQVVPLPAAVWAGLPLLGGMFGVKVLRRRKA